MRRQNLLSLALVLAALLVCGCGNEGRAEHAMSDAAQQDEARISLLGDQTIGPVFQRLEVYFPSETQLMLDEITTIRRRGGSHAESAAIARATMARILDSNAQHVSSAEPPALRAAAQTTLDGIVVLEREDLAACREMLVSGDLSSETRQRVSVTVHRALANATVATLDAIESGRQHPTQYSRPTPSDYQAMFARYEEFGGNRETLRTLMGPDGGSLSPDVACSTGRLMWTAILAMPDDFVERYMSSIWAPS